MFLLVTTTLVLIIACAIVGIVSLKRLVSRETEMSIRAALGAPGPVHPDTHDVSGTQASRGLGRPHLDLVDEDLPAFERVRDALTRPEPLR